MSHPLNTPLGRFGIVTSEEGPQRCVASIPAGGMINPLTGVPTVAALAMLVDHIGGLVNHHRRGPGELTVSSDLSLELAPNALAQLGSAAVNENRDDRPLNGITSGELSAPVPQRPRIPLCRNAVAGRKEQRGRRVAGDRR
jgi:hypothetical protein